MTHLAETRQTRMTTTTTTTDLATLTSLKRAETKMTLAILTVGFNKASMRQRPPLIIPHNLNLSYLPLLQVL